MSDIVNYAKRELELLGKDDDGLQERMNQQILDIVATFAEQGHTGFTAEYALSILERLLRWKPILPLTGEKSEWGTEASKNQNNRCYSVFRGENGIATDGDEFIVSDDGGITWYSTNEIPLTPITFPYTPPVHPKKIYIEYTEDVRPGYTSDKFDIITDDPERIKALYERKKAEFDENH